MVAKAKDERVAVITGTPMFYEGRQFIVGELAYMTREHADDYIALRHVRPAEPDELKRKRA